MVRVSAKREIRFCDTDPIAIITAAGKGVRSRDIVPGVSQKALFPLTDQGETPLGRAIGLFTRASVQVCVVSGGGSVEEMCAHSGIGHVVAPPSGEAVAVWEAVVHSNASHFFVFSGDNVLKSEEVNCAIRLSLDCRFAVGVAPRDDSPERAFVWV